VTSFEPFDLKIFRAKLALYEGSLPLVKAAMITSGYHKRPQGLSKEGRYYAVLSQRPTRNNPNTFLALLRSLQIRNVFTQLTSQTTENYKNEMLPSKVGTRKTEDLRALFKKV